MKMFEKTVVLTPILLAVIASTLALDLCDPDSLKNTTHYRYKNQAPQKCDCSRTDCIRKCCAVGFQASKGKCTRHDDTDYILKVPVYDGTTFVKNASAISGVYVGMPKCFFFPRPLTNDSDGSQLYYVQTKGTLLSSDGEEYDKERFCIDYLPDYKGLVAFVCFEDKEELHRRVNAIGMIISMPFLLTTFIAYALLPDRNLHMKALMFYVITLLISYLLLVILQLSEEQFDPWSCSLMGYSCVFFFMVSFFWMNVICIDIWFAFSGLRGFSGSKNAERKRFLIYCSYAWGMSILHIVVVYTIDKLAMENSWYHPGIGIGQCFLRTGYPQLLYFYGPMAILITINITLFAVTAIKIRSIKKDTSMLKREDSKRHSYENDKQTFNLYLKLLFAMGVNWSMEIISWAINWGLGPAPDAVWYLTDFCNAIYGVFIFFIFVFKRSIWKLLKKRYYSFIGKPHLAHSMTQNPTRVTSYSTTNTSYHESQHGNNVTDNTALTQEA